MRDRRGPAAAFSSVQADVFSDDWDAIFSPLLIELQNGRDSI